MRFPLLPLALLPLTLGCPGGEPVHIPTEETGDSTPPDTQETAEDTGAPEPEEIDVRWEWDPDDFYEIHDVGPDQDYASPCDVPWDELDGGALVRIHHQPEPYRCKWTITTEAYENHPLVIMGVASEEGELPVISGVDALTPTDVPLFQEDGWVVRVGGAEQDDVATWLYLQDLIIEGAHPDNSFTDDEGSTVSYGNTAAALRIEQASDIHLQGLELRHSLSGLRVEAGGERVLVSASWLHSNGSATMASACNACAEAAGITWEYTRFGPVVDGAISANIVDHSAGLVLRYSWIEGGNRQLELKASAEPGVTGAPDYDRILVYGNTFIEGDGDGSAQLLLFGGGGSEAPRPGALYLYDNTFLSQRSDRTTVMAVSSSQHEVQLHNNVLHATAGGKLLTLLSGDGPVTMGANWITTGWMETAEGASELVDDQGSIDGDDPGFLDLEGHDLQPAPSSPLQGTAGALPGALDDHPVAFQYLQHQRAAERSDPEDLGAFEG